MSYTCILCQNGRVVGGGGGGGNVGWLDIAKIHRLVVLHILHAATAFYDDDEEEEEEERDDDDYYLCSGSFSVFAYSLIITIYTTIDY